MTNARYPAGAGHPARQAKRTLLLLAAVCAAPVIASYTIYYLFPREATANYGTLLGAVPAPAIEGKLSDGARFSLAGLSGRWVLVMNAPGACGAACQRTLYATRQARTMQGKEQDRVVRLLLVADDATLTPVLAAEHPGLVVARVPAGAPSAFPAGSAGIYLIDPRGNVVLHFPDDPDIRRLGGDLARLLLASQIG